LPLRAFFLVAFFFAMTSSLLGLLGSVSPRRSGAHHDINEILRRERARGFPASLKLFEGSSSSRAFGDESTPELERATTCAPRI
jgi:hypothetical protein